MKSIIIAIIFVLFFVAVGLASPSNRDYVIVERGDTLAEIAQEHERDWRKLAEYNELANPHLIYPGQKIYLDRRFTDREMRSMASKLSWKIMEGRFVYRHRMSYKTWEDREWALEPLDFIEYLPTYGIKKAMNEVKRRLEWVDLGKIHIGILASAETPEDIMLLTAIIKVESSFRNVIGGHGEIGPMQILPIHGGRLDDPVFNVIRGWELLHHWGYRDNPFKAVERYNGRGDDAISHAERVKRNYQIYMQLFEEMLRSTKT